MNPIEDLKIKLREVYDNVAFNKVAEDMLLDPRVQNLLEQSGPMRAVALISVQNLFVLMSDPNPKEAPDNEWFYDANSTIEDYSAVDSAYVAVTEHTDRLKATHAPRIQ